MLKNCITPISLCKRPAHPAPSSTSPTTSQTSFLAEALYHISPISLCKRPAHPAPSSTSPTTSQTSLLRHCIASLICRLSHSGGSVINLTYIAANRTIPGYGGGMSSAKAVRVLNFNSPEKLCVSASFYKMPFRRLGLRQAVRGSYFKSLRGCVCVPQYM